MYVHCPEKNRDPKTKRRCGSAVPDFSLIMLIANEEDDGEGVQPEYSASRRYITPNTRKAIAPPSVTVFTYQISNSS
jgi:hypothetical protein